MAATSYTPLEQQLASLGLRERKKLRTRIAIRGAAFRLIAEQGYEATTVEQIAEASEVSPSTVFRYFPTKEDIVLTDEYDPLMAASLRSRPLDESPLDSFHFIMDQALRDVLVNDHEELVLRSRLLVQVPALRARMAETTSVTARMLIEILAERTGREPDDLELRVFTSAVLSALNEVSLYWAEHDCQGDLPALVHRALDSLENGLPL
ncbi:TetR/AcrR family transcriptional regulator [Streptomyces paludis]|uniref:TetR family transcriptional regulator n=1 Tax=Streptomyces paludis TaxID=2282738 RepID=A0A345HTH5_9ACTN|nr:TetR family transcriptional regulator [Streptomyces paludis]AXG79999.1 TetR family transcriptional regulator [Streptomyces paludis]